MSIRNHTKVASFPSAARTPEHGVQNLQPDKYVDSAALLYTKYLSNYGTCTNNNHYEGKLFSVFSQVTILYPSNSSLKCTHCDLNLPFRPPLVDYTPNFPTPTSICSIIVPIYFCPPLPQPNNVTNLHLTHHYSSQNSGATLKPRIGQHV